MRLQAKDHELFMHLVGVLDEAGVPWQAAGGNEVNVLDDTFDRLDGDQLNEVVAAMVPLEGVVLGVAEPDVPEPEPTPEAAGNAAPEVSAAPPRSGAGATRDAWAAYAQQVGVTAPAGASRDEIIALVDKQEAHGGS